MRFATLLIILRLTVPGTLHADRSTVRAADLSAAANSAPENVAQQIPNLQQQLQNGLKAIRPDQRQFVTDVVLLVNAGKLPLAMVKSAFKWALNKHPDYPFPYFQAALRLRAAAIGVNV